MKQRTVGARAAEVSIAAAPAPSEEPAAAQHAAAPAATPNEDVKGAMLEPSAANKQWVRALAVVAVTALMASTSVTLPGQGWRFGEAWGEVGG